MKSHLLETRFARQGSFSLLEGKHILIRHSLPTTHVWTLKHALETRIPTSSTWRIIGTLASHLLFATRILGVASK